MTEYVTYKISVTGNAQPCSRSCTHIPSFVRTYSIKCRGKSPLLMDRFIESEWVGECYPKPGHKPPMKSHEERCLPKIYRDAEGYPILKVEHLNACLKEVGDWVKVGGKKITNLDKLLEIEGKEFRLIFPEGTDAKSLKPCAGAEDPASFDPNSPWRVDVQRGAGDTGIANAIIRPRFNEWGFDLRVKIDLSAMSGLTLEHIQQLFERAGNRVGLLSYRPAKKGPFGRFKVDSFDIEPNM